MRRWRRRAGWTPTLAGTARAQHNRHVAGCSRCWNARIFKTGSECARGIALRRRACDQSAFTVIAS